MSNLTQTEIRTTFEIAIAVIFFLIIIITTVVGNVTVIAITVLQKKMRRDQSNMLIINLSIADLSNTLVMTSALVSLIMDKWTLGAIWCKCVCAINYCLIIVSMLTLCSISIDRYQAIINPLTYTCQVTRYRLCALIIYSWLQGITFGLAPSLAQWVHYDYLEGICAIQWHENKPNSIIYVVFAFVLCFLGPGVILIYNYIKILQEVKKQNNQTLTNFNSNSQTMKKKKRKDSEKIKIIWSLLVVVIAYFICTAPFSMTKLIKVLAKEQQVLPKPIDLSASLLGYIASAVNPLIYGIFRKDFRDAYKQFFCKTYFRKKLTMSRVTPYNGHAAASTLTNEISGNDGMAVASMALVNKSSLTINGIAAIVKTANSIATIVTTSKGMALSINETALTTVIAANINKVHD